ncbi:hypothetical protein ACFLRU_07035, partial [Bacteroidota bacterium]
MEYASIVISVLAILFSVFTYFKHDAEIKKQSKLINDYQLEKIESEKNDEKKAIISANVVKGKNTERIIKVYNKGKSIAKDLNVTVPENENYQVIVNPCPIDIKPSNGIELKILVFNSNIDKIKLKFDWKDDFK